MDLIPLMVMTFGLAGTSRQADRRVRTAAQRLRGA
jgi:hypothetical protein